MIATAISDPREILTTVSCLPMGCFEGTAYIVPPGSNLRLIFGNNGRSTTPTWLAPLYEVRMVTKPGSGGGEHG